MSNKMFDTNFVNSIINQNTLSEINASTVSQKSKLQEYRESSTHAALAGRPSEEHKSAAAHPRSRDEDEFQQLLELFIVNDS